MRTWAQNVLAQKSVWLNVAGEEKNTFQICLISCSQELSIDSDFTNRSKIFDCFVEKPMYKLHIPRIIWASLLTTQLGEHVWTG